MTNQVLKVRDIVDDYDLFLVDIWGVVFDGGEAYEGVVDALNFMISKKNVCFVSNTPRLRPSITQRLKAVGLNVSENMLYTSGEVAAKMLSQSQKYLNIDNPVVYHLCDQHFVDAYSEIKMNTTDQLKEANVMLVTAQMDEGYDLTMYDGIMEEAAKLGILCICVNPDTIIPDQGKLRYCPGYIVRNYKGKIVHTGKPKPEIFNMALNDYPHIPKSRVLMIGDTIDTDVEGAANVGINSALVNSGNRLRLFEELGITEVSELKNFSKILPTIHLALTLS